MVNRNQKTSSGENLGVNCKICSKNFTLNKNLLRHMRTSHDAAWKLLKCSKCGLQYKRGDSLKLHKSTCGRDTINQKRSICHYPDCFMKFYSKTSLIEHLKAHHGADLKEESELKFSSIEEFLIWKNEEEDRTSSYFSQQGGGKNGRIYYYCQRDGSSRPHCKRSEPGRKTSRRVKIGRIKTDELCIAMMKLQINFEDGSVSVLYLPTHSHSSESEINSPTYTIDNMNNQITLELAPEDFRYSSHSSERDNMDTDIAPEDEVISKAVIIQRCVVKARNKQRLHQEDSTSVFLIAKQLQLEKYNCVLIYKPVGACVIEGPKEIDSLPNSSELFMFGIQTKEQRDLMVVGSKTILVVEDSHNYTEYENFKLLNGLVVDETGRSWSVFHLITNRIDQKVLKYFFQILKKRSIRDLNINVVITNDTPELINGIEMGLAERVTHILCCWHVQKTFRRFLRKFAPLHLFEIMFKELLLLIYAPKEGEFLKLFESFLKKYQGTAPKFLTFLAEYKSGAAKWAKCYRNFPHGNVDTTGHAESLHNRLKIYYMKRLPNKRVDDLINLLLQMEEDDVDTRSRQALLGYYESPLQRHSKHVNGVAIPDSNLRQESDNIWFVKSSTNANTEYLVMKIEDQCSQDLCFDRCKELACPSLCGHNYSCTCPDNCPLCRHIHKVHSFSNKGHVLVVEQSADTVVKQEELFTLDEEKTDVPSSEIEQEKVYSQLEDNIARISEILQARTLPSHILFTLRSNIDEALRKCIASLAISEDEQLPCKPASRNEKLSMQKTRLQPFKSKKKYKQTSAHPTFVDGGALKADLLSHLDKEKKNEDFEMLTHSTMSLKTTNAKHHSSPELVYWQSDSESEQSDPESSLLLPSVQPADDLPPMAITLLSTENATSLSESFQQLSENFTPCFHDQAQLCDILLRLDHIKISLLHLKSLETRLTQNEENACKLSDKMFNVGWLYSNIIDAFLIIIARSMNSKVFIVEADVTLSILMGNKLQTIMGREMPDKTIFIFPVINSTHHWSVVLVLAEICSIRFYDPLQKPMSDEARILISNIIALMKLVKPKIVQWQIEPVFLPIQCDSFNCGTHVCWLAHHAIAENNEEYIPLTDPFSFHKFIYEVLCSGCEEVE